MIRWSEDGSFVEFAFPDTTLRLTIGTEGPCRLAADTVRYDLLREDGGSGGDAITLRAERLMGTRVLRLEWHGQAEDGTEPDLEEAFALMASAECEG